MGIVALVLSILGGLCAVMGIIIATAILPEVGQWLAADFTAMFWLALSAVLLLACIAAAVSRTVYE
jgi:Na+-transporting methylmalonyl-CoA/oxaloacetate decarboxylase gamma subunit